MRSTKVRLAFIAVLCAVGLLAGILIVSSLWVTYNGGNRFDFWLHRRLYEDIVRQAKSAPIPNDIRPGRLRVGGISACFLRDDRGNYTVSIVIVDNHAVTAGYLYCDSNPIRVAGHDEYNV